MIAPDDLLSMQRAQHVHDTRNHSEIVYLHKNERLKHYGLHFAKYVGRVARELDEAKPLERTLVDTVLVALSAANALHQNLSKENFSPPKTREQVDPLRRLADAAGRFADACEKIDHLEEFVPIAKLANRDVTQWVLNMATERNLDLKSAVKDRRKELAARHFYIE